jgi:hypothetical protein
VEQKTIRPEFKVHRLTVEGLEIADHMALKFSNLVDWLDEQCEHSPEYTLAKRKLEQACFYAKKAMAVKHTKHD